MNNIILYLLAFLYFNTNEQQCVNWKEARTFHFYNLPRNVTTERIKWPDIEKLKPVKINNAARILSNSECKEQTMAIWKDEYLLIVEFNDGKKRKFKVSGYGGFLYEPGGKFYFVQEKDRDEWQSVIQALKAQGLPDN
ncbi:hypothetical protein [Chitinophaga sp. ARDCPP14]|uniref:hypothetical protein n=1 Tax=Chitinophaga sp. ARDCPP14 TaxID=3391139 RepID=UPI003F526858